jgi:hypothetical protein
MISMIFYLYNCKINGLHPDPVNKKSEDVVFFFRQQEKRLLLIAGLQE